MKQSTKIDLSVEAKLYVTLHDNYKKMINLES